MNDDQQNAEIIKKIEKNTEKMIKDILAEQKTEIDIINREAEEEIERIKKEIIEDAKNKAEAEFQKEKAKQDLDLRLKVTKFRDEIVEEFIQKAKKQIEKKIETKEYDKSIEKLILEAALTLKQDELNLYCREKDKKKYSKQFLDKITSSLEKEGLKVKFNLSDKYIDSMGGVVIETTDGKISINNTYEKRIERSSDELKRELSLLLTEEG